MNVSQISNTVILIELSAEETKSYELSFSFEDYSSTKAREALWRVLNKAQSISGKAIEVTPKLSIDFLQDVKGGCLIIVTEGENEDTAGDTCRIYQSSDFENLLRFALALKNENYPRSALFRCGKSYRLFLIGAPRDELAQEFCLDALSGDIYLEASKEGYDCLIEEKALEVLCGFFLKK